MCRKLGDGSEVGAASATTTAHGCASAANGYTDCGTANHYCTAGHHDTKRDDSDARHHEHAGVDDRATDTDYDSGGGSGRDANTADADFATADTWNAASESVNQSDDANGAVHSADDTRC